MATLLPRGYRSATAHCFDEEQTNAIVRTTAYYRRDYCLSVIWFSPREHLDIRPPIAIPFQRISNVGVGSLDRIPLELLFDTLYRLDIHSLFKFRQINLRSRQMVDSLQQYQRVVSYGLNLFCALLRTRLAIDISLLDFYNVLYTKACNYYGEFGFISLLIWKRCYFNCLQWSSETQMRTLASVRKQFYMTKAELDQLRSFKALPGIYSMNQSIQNSRITIVSLDQATLAYRRQQPRLPQAQLAGLDRNQKINFMGSCALPYYDKQTYRVERGISCAGCQLGIEKVLSAPGARNGDTRLETKCMRKTAFWSIFSGVNRHSSYGDRVARVKTGHPSYLCLLGQEATFEEENDHHMEPIY